jgi:hypothetical protein
MRSLIIVVIAAMATAAPVAQYFDVEGMWSLVQSHFISLILAGYPVPVAVYPVPYPRAVPYPRPIIVEESRPGLLGGLVGGLGGLIGGLGDALGNILPVDAAASGVEQ